MKKKMMASLLVGSAIVGASLAPLSAQAVTTGNTPVQVEFGGGVLPDGDGFDNNTKDPDPNTSNGNFDLLFIPEAISFDKTSVSGDLSSIKSKSYVNYAVGDIRGTKEGWHVTATLPEMKNGEDKLFGVYSFKQTGYMLTYDETTNKFITTTGGINDFTNSPVAPVLSATSITIGEDASLMANASSGKGQGMWDSYMTEHTLNITTPYQQIKAGAYTGNITWNLVAGPSI
ncbi:WxL domain-containing protein [Enterococcus faecalis]|nr:WxL domain-containing protein [Enterococcus faecalis]EGO2841751.1 WxL domain-containing protein [Enterococcus faecalis]MBE9854783.1 WxL domain-containing protein [Enterococcus faecalis]MDN3073511.1 WxL domain-containing protein [Enterococcus faecalis]